jgi:DNA-directed RNA polymerase specialized sigma24 family protein
MPQLEQQAIEAESPVANLYQRHAPAILAYVRKHVACAEDAEDVLLDVFLAALEHHAVFLRLEERQQLAWLRHAAHNKFIDYHRRVHRRPAISLEMAEELSMMMRSKHLSGLCCVMKSMLCYVSGWHICLSSSKRCCISVLGLICVV